MAQSRISVLSLGGTISMTADIAGATPSLAADDLIRQLHHYLPDTGISATTLAKVGSPQLRIADARRALVAARRAVDEGAAGVVIVQGTDTLEETAWLLDLVWDRAEPLVITGAMRFADDAGAEGLGNLVASVRVAVAEQMRGQGVLAVLNDEVHLAKHVAKKDANHLQAFSSSPWGPIARLLEGRLHIVNRTTTRPEPLVLADDQPPRIPLLSAAYDDDGEALRAIIATRPRGIVLAAMGSGHLPVAMADAASEAVQAGIPVVFASRTGGGATTSATYGYPGSEADLLERGLIAAGWCEPLKARLLLHLLIAAGAESDQIRAEFALRCS